MDKKKQRKFTKLVSLGWWLGFILFISQAVIISMFNLCATPILGMIVFASFVILSFSHYYDKEYEFSPYKGLIKIFGRKKQKLGD